MNLSNKPIAMAYVPWQSFENVMDGCAGLAHGTIFEDLVFPFIGAQAACQAGPNNRSNNRTNGRPNNNRPPMNSMPSRQNCSCGRRCGY